MTTIKNATLSMALLAALGLCGSAFAQALRAEATGEAQARQSEQRSDNAAKGPVHPVLKKNARGTEVQSDIHAGHQMEQTNGAANASDRARDRAATNSAVVGTDTGVTTGTTTRGIVPASANASSNARIATSAPGAMAAERHMSGAGRFHLDTTLLDADRDGFLTSAEVASNQTLTQQFATIDTNRDSRLAADELRTWIRSGGLSMHQRPEGRDFERGGQRTRRVSSR